jgi:glycosyltransferase involved in cell wall biosynthesis
VKLLLTTDTVGGVWQYSTNLARALTPLGVEPILVVLGPPPSSEQQRGAAGLTLIETGLPLDWLAADREEVAAAGEAVARRAAQERADLVHLNSPALAAGASFDMPVLAVSHSCLATWWEAVIGGEISDDFCWRAELHGGGLRAADLVVTPTAAFGETTRRAYGLRSAPVTVHNGRAPLPLPESPRESFAFTAGRLWDKGKNLATLDRAAAALPVPLCAAGPLSGPNGDSIDFASIRALGRLSEQEIGRRLAARPVFVSAALYEPFGLAVLEAAAAGCPLVLSDIPTFRELWDGAATFVDPLDHEGFASAILQSLGDPERGAAAKERSARFTPDAMARSMLDIYRGLISPLPAREVLGVGSGSSGSMPLVPPQAPAAASSRDSRHPPLDPLPCREGRIAAA